MRANYSLSGSCNLCERVTATTVIARSRPQKGGDVAIPWYNT